MSEVRGGKKGRGRRRNRGNRGRGSQQLQSETTSSRSDRTDIEESHEDLAQLRHEHVEQTVLQNIRQSNPIPASVSLSERKHEKHEEVNLELQSEQEKLPQRRQVSLPSQKAQSKTVPAPKPGQRPTSSSAYGRNGAQFAQLSGSKLDVQATAKHMLPEKTSEASIPSQSSEVSELATKIEKGLEIESKPHGGTKPSQTIAKPSGKQPLLKSKPSKPERSQSNPRQPPRSDEAEPPRRPDNGGTLGQRIKLRVNFFPVSLPEIDIHHYRTEIFAKGCEAGKGYTKKEAPMIIKCMVEQYQAANPHGPKLVYDKNGENVYCKIPIPGIEKSREYTVLFTTNNGKEREYTVEIKWVSKVSLHDLNQALQGNRTEIPRDTMQAIEIVVQHLPHMTSIPVGDSFFKRTDAREKDLGFGLQVWNGTFLSTRPTQWKMIMLNVDTSSTVFYKAQPVLDFLCEYFKFQRSPRELNSEQITTFSDEITQLKIETTHIKRKQRVSGLSTESARNKMFDCDGEKVSVLEYFKKKYNITLQHPDLPCVKLGQNDACIPMELCIIMEGQRKQGKLTKEQLQAMIKHTALPAPERQQLINQLVRNAKFQENEFLADFGFKIGQEMPTLTGRVLEPPMIEYGQGQKELPRNGQWNMQHLSYKTVDLDKWAIISFENQHYLNDATLKKFVSSLVQAGKDKGLAINPSPCYFDFKRGSERIGEIFRDIQSRNPNLQLLVVVLPGKGNLDAYYEAIKYYGDISCGVRTQVIKANTAIKKAYDRQTMANICLKINAKLGGTTFTLDKSKKSEIFQRPVIIFGADVTHPSSSDVHSPSIAAVVASMDSKPNIYTAEVRVQERRREIITDLKDIVKILLKKFKTATKFQPEKIIFYRDGVGEGQFKEVLVRELRAIQLACYELHESFKPAITFIVVQKRHHTRFFAENPRDQCGKSKNIPAGTVVDTDVCHPYEFDWYLCSHAGIQGTSKPAHYHVLYDDSSFTSDQLQTLTNQLCHTYVRCAKAVSIPAPAYYAHHVAFRARYHLGKLQRDRKGKPLTFQEMSNAVNLHERMANTMYFA